MHWVQLCRTIGKVNKMGNLTFQSRWLSSCPPETLDKFLSQSKYLGFVDMSAFQKKADMEVDADEKERPQRVARMPALGQCYNLTDFEAVARSVMKKTAWEYCSSGADDDIIKITL